MTLTIKLTPIKQLFSNPSNGYRVISCIASEYVPNLELNNYGNFTLSGSNLSNLAIGTEYELEIRKDERSKYPASYVLVGWAGVEIGENVTIKPEQEIGFLSMCMERVQAERVHEAYPNFVQMVLDGRENELDYKNIYNDIVEDLRNKDFLSTNDYNKIHMKPIMKKIEIEDEKEQDDDFDIGM